jgi:glutamate/tyrosine decarboxylase-like PLP-dependent enzyme
MTAHMEEHRLRTAPLSMDADEFKTLGHELVDQIAELLASVPSRPVTPPALSPQAIRDAFGLENALPERGMPADALLTETARQLFECSLFNAHPRFFGYITAPPAPIGILGDFLASALNANVGMWTLAPAATEIEGQTIRWLAELIGFPAGDGLLVSGGNAANINCFIAARAAVADWDVRREGVGAGRGRQLVAYASKEAHTWIQKAADICGLGTDAIRWIETNAHLQMDTAALRRAIDADAAAGRLPFLVAGTAGSVSTGVVDRLDDISAVCREKAIWFHVDGAYGGFAAALPDAAPALRALREANSIAVDPHKWLYSPLEAGCALVRDADALTRAFAYHPPYYHMDQRVVNYVEHGSQNSRGFRALKVWLSLKQVGAAAFRQMIADDMRLARALADFVDEHPELELVTQALSITTFRYVPADLSGTQGDAPVDHYLNELNQKLLDELQRGGEIFVSNAVVGGRYALRACIVNFHTTAGDVEAVPHIVARQGRTLDARLRPATLRRQSDERLATSD